MTPKPTGCDGCPARDYGIGFVPPTTPASPEWVVVGQGPGNQEAIFSQPFYHGAPAGRMLRGWLHEAGVPAERTAFGNIVCCWLPRVKLSGELGRESRPPSVAEVTHCWRAYVSPWLAALPPEAPILAVGAPATRFLLGLSEDEPVERLAGVTHLRSLPPAEGTNL